MAAIFIATGSLLPNKRTGLTGDETAIELIRQSWINRPLDQMETKMLENVYQLSFKSPTIKILAHLLYK